MDNIVLKLCSFCGNEKVRVGRDNWYRFVTCRECGADGPYVGETNVLGPTEEAISKWNTRSILIRCS